MLAKKGVQPNRKKHQIMSNAVPMKVHKLNVNSGRPTLSKKKRNNIKLELYNLTKFSKACKRQGLIYKTKHQSVRGKVFELKKFHPKLGERYMSDLAKISPR